MSTTINQVDNTRNQSTAHYDCQSLFLFNNTYQEAVFNNTTAGVLELSAGTLVLRNATTPGQIKPAIAGATLADVIGVLKLEDPASLAAGETLPVNFCTGGDVDEALLQLPDGVTMDTIVGQKTLRDILNGLGFSFKASTDNTKIEN